MTSAFSAAELAYLHDETRRLGRIATADSGARPQVTPVGMWKHNTETDTIDVTGRQFATTKKFRNVEANPWASIVIDDIASFNPWRPRAVIVEGRAEAVPDPDNPGDGHIRITPDRVIAWGVEQDDHRSE